jgi:hypothetical protein
MKVIEHVYAIKNLLSSGASSDDVRITNALILHFLSVVRSKLIQDKIDKYSFVNEQSYQTVCLELEESSFHDCCNLDYEDCPILKTKEAIPKLLQSRLANNLKITDASGKVIPQINMTQLMYSKYSDVPQMIGYFINNNKIIIVNNKNLKVILVSGIFDDPERIDSLNCSGNEPSAPCNYLESQFPIDSDLVALMYEGVISLLTIHLRTTNDITNNAREDRSTADVSAKA